MDRAACTRSLGKYLKYFSFHWSPMVAARDYLWFERALHSSVKLLAL